MLVIADVDLGLLHDLRYTGSVRNLKDRRMDLYNIDFKGEKNQPKETLQVMKVFEDGMA